jgi:hypothetical protein
MGDLGQILNICKNTWKGNVLLWGDRFVTLKGMQIIINN